MVTNWWQYAGDDRIKDFTQESIRLSSIGRLVTLCCLFDCCRVFVSSTGHITRLGQARLLMQAIKVKPYQRLLEKMRRPQEKVQSSYGVA